MNYSNNPGALTPTRLRSYHFEVVAGEAAVAPHRHLEATILRHSAGLVCKLLKEQKTSVL